ncbi:hypothetical protein H5410_036508 [Solanum commersonii]|uniref:Uncharacterized protein n=1 Tax=Solanum commersonii TaxID=4109 RepID=A0A9J5Y7N2_SOLCO|nr:hypothetical protein H5410_036508 [Solanum commersonii]
MFRSFFSIGAPASIHLGVVLEMRGASQPFRSSRTHLNKKVEASNAQSPIVVDEQKEELQPFNYTLFFNVNVEKEYKSENVVNMFL